MRLGVIDIGSNTGHLLVVDAHGGAAPSPASKHKRPLRLAEHLDDEGAVTAEGIEALTAFVSSSLEFAETKGCEEIYCFATSAVRDAVNAEAVLEHVQDTTGVEIRVLPGEDEARLTFLAVRRWFGWSSGRLGVFDIGGGSLEIAAGSDAAPDVAWSLPLGAARLARRYLVGEGGRVAERKDTVRLMRKEIRTAIAHDAGNLLRSGPPDHAVATSKTFRSLSRICGAAPSSEGPHVPRALSAAGIEEWLPKLIEMDHGEIADLPGVSKDRAHQILPGALVASAIMDIFDLEELDICPWALREGVILERLDKLSVLG